MDSGFQSILEKPQPPTPAPANQAVAPFEPFFEEWRAAATGDGVLGHKIGPEAALILTNRQLAIIGFLGLAAMALMASLAYVAGRSAFNGPSEVLMVESAKSPIEPPATAHQSAVPISTMADVQPSAAAPSVPANATQKAITQANPVQRRPAPRPTTVGEAYWQIGALDEGMAEISRKYLEENSLPVRLEPITGSKQLRVMVGPAIEEQISGLQGRLQALGFQPFLKRY